MKEEEHERKMKKQKTEKDEGRQTEEEAEEAVGVKSNDNDSERKKDEHCEMRDCEQKTETLRTQTSYYCKTCSGEPSLCPVPCFELYHTRLIYKTAPELEIQGEHSY